ncbi:ribonuclease P protein subunit, partial [Candidatus Woesearchaeota archaeon]|nr:ribonuclease P protein subunit [Candidatus Woesearchaeota archaeon]
MHINYELIGQYITITESKNKSLIRIKGKIVDETRNTLTIKTSNGEKK